MDILKNNNYISLKELNEVQTKYKNLINKSSFFKKFKLKYKCLKLEKKIIKHNEKYIAKEIKETSILNNISGFSLDDEQKRAVITDEDSCLIVAGAGSGKTLTMVGKIKYLLNKGIDPKEILCISFTNFTTLSFLKALEKNKIEGVSVLTFHKLSLSIIKENTNVSICKDNLLENIIVSFFKEDLLKNRKLLTSFVNDYIIKSNVNLGDEQIVLDEEIIISNFLYVNNIKYSYKWIGFYKKNIYAFYLEDYDIYIKYFNLDIDTLEEIDNIRGMLNFTYLAIYRQMFTENTVFDEINNFLKENNVKIKSRKIQYIYEIFSNKSNKIINLSKTIMTFINLFKSGKYSFLKFDEIKKKINNKKLLIILEIIKQIYIKYQTYLSNNNQIDFNDMINIATDKLKNNEVILKYKYIIIDEYQDTSFSRYELIKIVKNQTNSKLIAVGDDFQSIYRFTGCDVKMFIDFKKYFPFSKILYLTNTYRNSSELIKVAGDFIMKNKYQIKKNLKSKKKLYKPIKIYLYKDKEEINLLFKKIKEKDLFVLGRNNNDINLFRTKEFKINENKIIYKDKDIKFMSVHKSKGLEAEAVVIVNLEDKVMGFPSKCVDDEIISFIKNDEEYYPYEEERRLFYVALTRTKGNTYLFVPVKRKSIFINEIMKDNLHLLDFIN